MIIDIKQAIQNKVLKGWASRSAAAPTLGKRGVWWWLCCADRASLLVSLIFVYFVFFCFPVKCAEAGWLLEVSFHSILNYGCFFGHACCYFGCPESIIWQAWCLPLARWGPSWQFGDTLGVGGLDTRCLYGGIAKVVFSQQSFSNDLRVEYWFFSEAFGVVFVDICCLGGSLENVMFFQDPEWRQKIKGLAG